MKLTPLVEQNDEEQKIKRHMALYLKLLSKLDCKDNWGLELDPFLRRPFAVYVYYLNDSPWLIFRMQDTIHEPSLSQIMWLDQMMGFQSHPNFYAFTKDAEIQIPTASYILDEGFTCHNYENLKKIYQWLNEKS